MLKTELKQVHLASTFFENPGTEKFLSVSQLAHYLAVSPKTIYGWVYRGLIEPERVGPRLIRFKAQNIEQWLQLQRK